MRTRSGPYLIGAVALILVATALCACCLFGSRAFLRLSDVDVRPLAPEATLSLWREWPGSAAEGTVPGPDATLPLPTAPSAAVVPDEAYETLGALEAAVIPVSDLHDLAIRYLGVPADTPRVAATEPADYPVGTIRSFNVSNLDTDETFEIDARMVYKTEHVYMWVEEGLNVYEEDIRQAADLFEAHTYPTTRAFFGSEWTPGVDGDPRLGILHASNLGRTVAGYYASKDSYVRAVRSDSNEMEMFYIHVTRPSDVGDPFYNGVLAHEFQHMIHWANDRNETTWLNEGCSELAVDINDRTYPGGPGMYDVGGSEYAYLDNPDTQLNTWPEVSQTGSAAPHYGAAYLFMSYFLERFGSQATQALVAHPENGMRSVDKVLQDELGLTMTHEDLFADWVIANLLDDPTLDAGQYGYTELDIGAPALDQAYGRLTRYPQTRQTTVNQYAVDYIEISGRNPLTLDFTGSNLVRLLNTDAYSGRYLWWSNRADESHTRLTRRVDLGDVASATLAFQGWYHIEKDWDYAYVVVGTTDAGSLPEDLEDPQIRWQILEDEGLGCTTSNPNNGNLGCGLTGRSQGWEQLEADLTPFAGQEIALAFEYVTDAAVNQPGLAIDDIILTADGVTILGDDVESGEGDWIAEGFVRHANLLPQRWIVQLVTFGDGDHVTVQRLLSGEAISGTWTIPLTAASSRAVLAISATAPATTEPATYTYTLSAVE